MKVAIVLNQDDLQDLGCPIVVEAWEKAVGRHSYGKPRRRWLAEFSAAERKKAGSYHTLFHRWYIGGYDEDKGRYIGGPPQEYVTSGAEIDFIRRLVHFFATL